MKESQRIPFWERYTLTIEEAAQYFRIGEHKLRQIISENKDAEFVLWNGNRVQIKRKLFEKYIDQSNSIWSLEYLISMTWNLQKEIWCGKMKCYVRFLFFSRKGVTMSEKRRDNKGRVLRNGESQRSDGKYMFRYTDNTGERHTVYSWKLVSTDKLKEGQRDSQALRDMEKRILKDLDDSIKTRDAEHTTVDDLFEQFMDIRKDLRESSRFCYNDIYRKHIKPVIGYRPIGKVKPTEIQKLYQIMVSESGVNPTTAQKAHSIIYQLFENAVMDNVIRMNPASNAFRNFRKAAELNPACREPLTVAQQEVFIDYIYTSEKYGRMANLFTVLLGTGMRIGEALGLRWCDCDFEEGIIHVTHALLYKQGEDGNNRYRISAPKTEAGFREIPMFDDVKAALQRERGAWEAEIQKEKICCGWI